MWVAREENGLLRLYTKKPYRYNGGIWRIPNDGDCITISDEEYPICESITWEDEPQEVCICLNNEKYHTIKLEELNRLYEIDWKYQDKKETLESYQDMIDDYRKLPWYKRIFNNI